MPMRHAAIRTGTKSKTRPQNKQETVQPPSVCAKIEDSRNEDGDESVAQITKSLKRSSSMSIANFQSPVAEDSHRILDSMWFHAPVHVMTGVNTITMGIEADHPDWKNCWIAFENVFTATFFLEMVIKLYFMRWKYFKDRANCLDFALVLGGILDCWILSLLTHLPTDSGAGLDLQMLSILRILRLARLARVLKLVRGCKPLVVMLAGLQHTLSTLVYVFVLLFLVSYVFAIFLTENLGDRGNTGLYPGYSFEEEVIDAQEFMVNFNPSVCFGSMARSMMTLFNMAILAEWQDVVRPVALKQPFYAGVFFMFAFFAAFGIMNVMIALIVDGVIGEAKNMEEEYVKSAFDDKMASLRRIQTILSDIDTSHDGNINEAELSNAMENHPLFDEVLSSINLPTAWSAGELLAMLDIHGDGAVGDKEFMQGMFRLMESDHFQQICIMQAGINQLKKMIKTESKVTQARFAEIETEMMSRPYSMNPAAEFQASFGGSSIYSTVSEEPCGEISQPSCSGTVTEPTDVVNDIPSQIQNTAKHEADKRLIEMLDAAYLAMKESFVNELSTASPIFETWPTLMQSASTPSQTIDTKYHLHIDPLRRVAEGHGSSIRASAGTAVDGKLTSAIANGHKSVSAGVAAFRANGNDRANDHSPVQLRPASSLQSSLNSVAEDRHAPARPLHFVDAASDHTASSNAELTTAHATARSRSRSSNFSL